MGLKQAQAHIHMHPFLDGPTSVNRDRSKWFYMCKNVKERHRPRTRSESAVRQKPCFAHPHTHVQIRHARMSANGTASSRHTKTANTAMSHASARTTRTLRLQAELARSFSYPRLMYLRATARNAFSPKEFIVLVSNVRRNSHGCTSLARMTSISLASTLYQA